MDTGIGRTPAIRWAHVGATALAAVGWAYLGMAAVAYAALALLDAGAVGELGPGARTPPRTPLPRPFGRR